MKSKLQQVAENYENTIDQNFDDFGRGLGFDEKNIVDAFIEGALYAERELLPPKQAIFDILKHCEDMAIWDKIPNSAYYKLKKWIKDGTKEED